MSDLMNEFKALLTQLDGKLASTIAPAPQPDAIDAVLAEPERTTAVVSLAGSPEVAKLEEQFVDAEIRNDFGVQLLTFVNSLLTMVVARM